MTQRVFNFSPGPANLPLPVLEEVRRDLLALPGVGMSVLEISHRSKTFDAILEETESNLRQLLEVPDSHRVLFLQGGAQLQFSMVPINFLRDRSKPAAYVLTGSWGSKAIKEAEREGRVQVAWTGKEDNFVRVPDPSELDFDTDGAYLHYTSNETIQGVQFGSAPRVAGSSAPLICDASSDFLSRPFPVAEHGLIYACAQKNAGPAGLTVLILSEDLLAERAEGLHSMLDYGRYDAAGSRLNTPPTFAIYVLLLITRWLRDERGGLERVAQENREKAALLYDVLDEDHGAFYLPHAESPSRSQMNVTFRLANEDLVPSFLEDAAEQGLFELKGHRSVGGFRASIYNAMPREGVERLRDFMLDFRARNG